MRLKKTILLAACLFMVVMVIVYFVCQPEELMVPLSSLDLLKVEQDYGSAQRNRTIQGRPLTIAGEAHTSGLGTHAESVVRISLDGRVRRFRAEVGLDDEARGPGEAVFRVVGDEQELFSSGLMKTGQAAKPVDVSLKGVRELLLLVEPGPAGSDNAHADWVDAEFIFTGTPPNTVHRSPEAPYILTPKPGPLPRINSPRVFGVRPASPVVYTVAATGQRPMAFTADPLPQGLTLDSVTGQLSGSISQAGSYHVELKASNAQGVALQDLRIEVGQTLALTPPMGWNSWNCWGCAVDQDKILASARALVDTGLINHGWCYVNIDDCWMINSNAKDPLVNGPARDEQGMLVCNRKFPDMPGLVEDIHTLGLKAGIYISPGPTTCQGYEGSYQHEMQDAAQFAIWGFDYLKYDWCGYRELVENPDRQALMKPYQLMKECLDEVPRDILYSLCQYGMGQVWQWGESVGGHSWRTTNDIVDTWASVSEIGFSQDEFHAYAGPGHWNDPDMLVLGRVGWGRDLHPTELTPDEQYTHMSLWCLLNAPLLLGCDLTGLDDFTLNLLTNDEVLSVNQDPRGEPAKRLTRDGMKEVWGKTMADGSKAVGLFNRTQAPDRVTVQWKYLGLTGPQQVRDLWRQKDLGVFEGRFMAKVPRHGVVLIKITKAP
ncbi:MAG: NPCBM/NEW2 domain-containing protein [Phycisphaeraceae bacterium]|nr:NPCBM/NEW2 domain-containing protein [Phycisphaeraceae bacterium]